MVSKTKTTNRPTLKQIAVALFLSAPEYFFENFVLGSWKQMGLS